MRFCSKCGSFMRTTKDGFLCPRCGNLVQESIGLIEVERFDHPSDSVYVADNSGREYTKVNRMCPRCGNTQAFHWFSNIMGEHAGVRSERTIEHLKCTECQHTWTESH